MMFIWQVYILESAVKETLQWTNTLTSLKTFEDRKLEEFLGNPHSRHSIDVAEVNGVNDSSIICKF